MVKVYVLFQGRYNSIDKEMIGVFSSVDAARKKAELIIAEDEISGLGTYAAGPGISYVADSGILFRGQLENPYSLWVVEKELVN